MLVRLIAAHLYDSIHIRQHLYTHHIHQRRFVFLEFAQGVSDTMLDQVDGCVLVIILSMLNNRTEVYKNVASVSKTLCRAVKENKIIIDSAWLLSEHKERALCHAFNIRAFKTLLYMLTQRSNEITVQHLCYTSSLSNQTVADMNIFHLLCTHYDLPLRTELLTATLSVKNKLQEFTVINYQGLSFAQWNAYDDGVTFYSREATPLHVACENQLIDCVRLLLQQPEIDLQARCYIVLTNTTPNHSYTALQIVHNLVDSDVKHDLLALF